MFFFYKLNLFGVLINTYSNFDPLCRNSITNLGRRNRRVEFWNFINKLWQLALEGVCARVGDGAVGNSGGRRLAISSGPQPLLHLDADGVVLLLQDGADGAVAPGACPGAALAGHGDDVVVSLDGLPGTRHCSLRHSPALKPKFGLNANRRVHKLQGCQ